MPWRELSIMDQRAEFVALARTPGANISMLCERFGISRETGYVWIRRFASGGAGALADRSRRPRTSPSRTGEAMEQLVLALRDRHPAWGGRKLGARLTQLGHDGVPSASTITAILRRHGRIEETARACRAITRFEYERPNDLWQMDFKGPTRTGRGPMHALTALDDHSRFAVVLRACDDQKTATVKSALTAAFGLYGLPLRMLADNGPPWSGSTGESWTVLKVWLLKLRVVMIHGRPYHPQTQGKEERFHRTLGVELLRRADLRSLTHAQTLMDAWRDVYNLERPHESADLKPPVSRYTPSDRAMPARLPEVEPSPDHTARRVKEGGHVRHAGQRWYLGKAWDQEVIGLRPTARAGVTAVYFGPYLIAELNEQAREAGERVRHIPLGRSAPSRDVPESNEEQ